MAGLSAPDYLAHIGNESARFRQAVAAAPTEVQVPTCPDWDADDLLWHVAEVQWFWATVIANRPAGPPPDRPDRPSGRAALLDFFDEASADLIDRLAEADPTEEAWSWSNDQTVGFTFRRQAHEVLIHRLDAELITGQTTALPADLASDGVTELMEVMHGGQPPSWARFTTTGRHTAIELSDTAERIRVATGRFEGTNPDSGKEYDIAHLLRVDDGPADAVIRGNAGDIDAWLWRRRDDADIAVEGDQTAYREWRAAVDQPID